MIVIIGESGCGKSTVEKKLVEIGYKKAISHTSREPREGEIDGVDYFFVSRAEIERMNSEGVFAEYIPYLNNIYALCVEECKDDRIAVVEPTGLSQLQEKDFLDVFVVYLYATEETRRSRMLFRGDSPSKVAERLTFDREIFEGISEKASIIIDTNSKSVDEMTNELIERYMSI